ncbi:MAG: hypothetical protein RL885_22980 [Planctomycetota bacterium]
MSEASESWRISRLLRLGLEKEEGPARGLIQRLSGPKGAARFRELIHRPPFDLSVTTGLLDGSLDLPALDRLKEKDKVLFSSGDDSELRLTGMAAYFLAIAGALAHHGQNICSRPREEVDRLMLDLAEVAPEPWSELLARAAMA